MVTLVGCGPNIFVKGFADEWVSRYQITLWGLHATALSSSYYNIGPHAFQISFTNFLFFAFPVGVMLLITCWLWLQLLYNRREWDILTLQLHILVYSLLPWTKKDPNEVDSQKHLQTVLKDQYKQLGPLSWQEGTISILFVTMVPSLDHTRLFQSSRMGDHLSLWVSLCVWLCRAFIVIDV